MMSRLYRRTGYFSICNLLEHKTPWGNLGIILFDWEGGGGGGAAVKLGFTTVYVSSAAPSLPHAKLASCIVAARAAVGRR